MKFNIKFPFCGALERGAICQLCIEWKILFDQTLL